MIFDSNDSVPGAYRPEVIFFDSKADYHSGFGHLG